MRISTHRHVVDLRDSPGRQPSLVAARLAVLPGQRPEWRPPHRLIGLIYRTVGRAFEGATTTA